MMLALLHNGSYDSENFGCDITVVVYHMVAGLVCG